MGTKFIKVIWLNKNIYSSRICEFLIDRKVYFLRSLHQML